MIEIDMGRNSWALQIEVERRIINNIPIQATKMVCEAGFEILGHWWTGKQNKK